MFHGHDDVMATTERTDFGPKQIKHPSELSRGMVVVRRGRGKNQKFVILGTPKDKWVHVQEYGGKNLDEVSLADNGVIPYDTGLWHKYHWLEFIGQVLEGPELEKYFQPR